MSNIAKLIVLLVMSSLIFFNMHCGDGESDGNSFTGESASESTDETDDEEESDPCVISGCDNIVCENMTFAAFEAAYLQAGNAGETTCIAPGYTVTNVSNGQMTVAGNNISIIGDDDDATVEFANTSNTNNSDTTDDSIFLVDGVTGASFSDLTVSMAGQEGRAFEFQNSADSFDIDNVRVEGSQSTDLNERPYAAYIVNSAGSIDNSDFYCDPSGSYTCNGVLISTSTSGTRAITVSNTDISTRYGYGVYMGGNTGTNNVTLDTVDITAFASDGVYTDTSSGGSGSTLDITGGTIAATGTSWGSAVGYRKLKSGTITNSTLSSLLNGTSDGVIDFVGNQSAKQIVMTGSTIESNGAYAIRFGTHALGVHEIDISNNVFKHMNSGTDREAIFVEAANHEVNSTSNGNTFCKVGTATFVEPVLTGAHSGNIVLANQVNSGSVLASCP